MKPVAHLILLLLLNVTLAFAAAPKATVSVAPISRDQWPAEYRLTLLVPPDHHAYLDQGEQKAYIPVKLDPNGKLAEQGLRLGEVKLPAGEHDAIVKATVLRNQGEFRFTLAETPNKPVGGPDATLEVRYQLCNDISHVCFRPQTGEASLTLPAASERGDAAASDAGIMDRLLGLFHDNRGNLPLLFGLMFLAGLFSVATPCVYPMLPITSMFIISRAEGVAAKEKQHALAYFIGMVATYMLLGLIAGLTGGAFNAFMQSAWVNLGFAVFFAFFAISLLGYYELSFMQNEVSQLDQQSAKVKGVVGTLMMGSVAGLVISPCVGPIVFALLLQVADNIAQKADALAALNQSMGFSDKLAIASEGSLMMAGFGLGVGLPFFLIGIIKFKKIPKAGYWMNKIKYAFGVMILYFAYGYLEKGMGVLGAEAATTRAFAFGLIILWLAVIHFNVLSLVPKDAPASQKIQHYAGVISVIIGAWLVVASLGRLPLTHAAQANVIAQNCAANGTIGNAATIQHEGGIPWYRSFAAAKKVAQQTGKPIFIDFFASWCANCIEFKKETVNNPALNQALKEKAVAVKLVDQEPEFEQFKADAEHRPLKIGLPYFAIINPDGKLVWTGTDYKATDTMVAKLEQAL